MKINDIHAVQLVGSSRFSQKSFLLKCDDKIVLVDTGRSEEDAERIMKYAKDRLSLPLEKYGDMCIITHHHGDHIGGLKNLKEVCSFKVAAHLNDFKRIEEASGVKVDIKLEDGETLPYCGGIKIIHVPGHTSGNICLYLKNKKILIAGDTVFADEKGKLIPPPNMFCEDPDLAKKGLKRLLELDLEAILVSHGESAYTRVKDKLEAALKA